MFEGLGFKVPRLGFRAPTCDIPCKTAYGFFVTRPNKDLGKSLWRCATFLRLGCLSVQVTQDTKHASGESEMCCICCKTARKQVLQGRMDAPNPKP